MKTECLAARTGRVGGSVSALHRPASLEFNSVGSLHICLTALVNVNEKCDELTNPDSCIPLRFYSLPDAIIVNRSVGTLRVA